MSGKINVIRDYQLSKQRHMIGGKSLNVMVRYDGVPLNDLSAMEKFLLEEAWYDDDINGDMEYAGIDKSASHTTQYDHRINCESYNAGQVDKE